MNKEKQSEEYMVCESCGHKQLLSDDVKMWPPEDPDAYVYYCDNCGVIFEA